MESKSINFYEKKQNKIFCHLNTAALVFSPWAAVCQLLSAVPASAALLGSPAPGCSSPAGTQQPGYVGGDSPRGRSAACTAGWPDQWSQSVTRALWGSWVWWWLTGRSPPSDSTDSLWPSWSRCSAGWCLDIQGPYSGYTAPLRTWHEIGGERGYFFYWETEIIKDLLVWYSPIPNSTKFSFSSVSMSKKRSVTWSSFRYSMLFGSYAKLAKLASTCSFASDVVKWEMSATMEQRGLKSEPWISDHKMN